MVSITLLLAARLLAHGEVAPVAPRQDETLVTARKQAEPLADVPLSVTVIDGRELALERLLTVRDAAARVPNVYVSEFTSRRLSFPFVRGIGSGLGDPAVITYIDDVPQFGFGGTNLPLFAVERIEFLRGPQGTLYGKNALGGLIHVRGRRPEREPSYALGATSGSYDLREYSGSYSGPMAGGLATDVAALYSERDGYSKNVFTGNDVDDRRAFFGRGRVLWQPSASSEVDFSVFGERARDGGFALSFLEDFAIPGLVDITGLRNRSHRIDQDFEGRAHRDVLSPSLVWRVFGDELDFTSVSSFQRWDVLELSDFDFTPVDAVRRRSEDEQRYLYQELRVASSDAGAARRVEWLVGASGFTSARESAATNVFRPGGAGIFFPPANVGADANEGDFDELGWAVFGQASVPLGDFALEGGLRYDREEKEAERLHTFDPGGGPFVLGQDAPEEDFDELLPMAGLTWHVTEQALAYLRAARGFKAGGFNLSSPAGFESFDAETNWTYELGYRHSFAAERHALGATVFLVDWEELQVSQFDPMAGGFVANAGEAESQGLELEAETRFGGGFEARASFGLLDTEIDDSGADLPQAPETTGSLGLRYERAVARERSWYVRADYQHVGDFYYDPSNAAGDSFELVNAGVGVVLGRLALDFWVQNLFDEEYVPIAFDADPTAAASYVGESGAPRVVGFTLSFQL